MAGQEPTRKSEKGLRVKRYIQLPIGNAKEQEVDVIEITKSDLDIIKMFWDVSGIKIGDFIIQFDNGDTTTITRERLEQYYKLKAI